MVLLEPRISEHTYLHNFHRSIEGDTVMVSASSGFERFPKASLPWDLQCVSTSELNRVHQSTAVKIKSSCSLDLLHHSHQLAAASNLLRSHQLREATADNSQQFILRSITSKPPAPAVPTTYILRQ